MKVSAILAFVALLGADLTGMPALAADPSACTLTQIVSLDMSIEDDGEVAIPAAINGHNGLLLIDTGSIESSINQAFAAQLNLRMRLGNNIYYLPGGVPIFQVANVDKLQLGPMSASDVWLQVVPWRTLEHDVFGMLAPDIMHNYDMDFDFAAGKLNIFSQDHCEGQVVYWTKQPYSKVPMSLDNDGHIIVPALLDGKKVKAVVDTGTGRSTIRMDMATALFGITEKSPGLKANGSVAVNRAVDAQMYHYPFASLTFEGVTVQTPVIDILGGERFEGKEAEMILGIQTLRQMHMYIAYREHMIYLTPAEAR